MSHAIISDYQIRSFCQGQAPPPPKLAAAPATSRFRESPLAGIAPTAGIAKSARMTDRTSKDMATILPSPPDSPELRPLSMLGLPSPSKEHDIEAAHAYPGAAALSPTSAVQSQPHHRLGLGAGASAAIEMQPVGSTADASHIDPSELEESESDPLLLRSRLINDEDIATLRRRASTKRGFGKRHGKKVGE